MWEQKEPMPYFMFLYTRRKKNWINFTIKSLELDFSNFFNHSKNNQNNESLVEACEGERCLWYVSFVIYKNRYEKAESRKKVKKNSLAPPVASKRIVASNFTFAGIESRIFVFVLVISYWIGPTISSKSCGVMRRRFLESFAFKSLFLY